MARSESTGRDLESAAMRADPNFDDVLHGLPGRVRISAKDTAEVE
jgi:hypothetical protein